MTQPAWLIGRRYQLMVGDVRSRLELLRPDSVHTAVTSPPYWALRDYSEEDQIGLEEIPDCMAWAHTLNFRTGVAQLGVQTCGSCHVCTMVEVFRAVRRVLRKDGTLWLNYGDCYNAHDGNGRNGRRTPVLEPKDLLGMAWRVAFALQADGWILRSDIVWSKPNPMPQAPADRPTRSHEYLFLFSLSPRYFYDADAIRESPLHPELEGAARNIGRTDARDGEVPGTWGVKGEAGTYCHPGGRNKRTVWDIPIQGYTEAHFATFPLRLVRPCILAGTSEHGACGKCGAPWVRQVEVDYTQQTGQAGPKHAQAKRERSQNHMSSGKRARRVSTTTGWEPSCNCKRADERVPCTVLDPFAGAGTAGVVALEYGRRFIGVELSMGYAEMADKRLREAAAQGVLQFG